MTNDYKMAHSSEELLSEVKNALRSELSKNINTINKLKDIMLDKEVISENDF